MNFYKKPKVIALAILLIVGGILFTSTNPSTVSVGFIVIPFLYFFSVTYLVVSLAYDLFKIRSRPVIPFVVSLLVLLILILGSLHQLSLRDVIICAVLIFALGFYLRKLEIN